MTDIEDLLRQAQAAIGGKRLEEARDLYARICASEGADSRAWLVLGTLHGQLGHLQEAAASFRKGLERFPDNVDLRASLAKALHAQGLLAEAAECYDHILEANPGLGEAWYSLGVVRGQQGDYAAAEQCFRNAVDSSMREQPLAHFSLGSALQAQGKLDEAAFCFEWAVRLKPDYVEAHNNLGVVLQAKGDLEKAAEAYRKATDLQPGYAMAWYNLGTLFREQGKFQEAADQYLKAIQYQPAYAQAHNALGLVQQAQGLTGAAEQSYRMALQHAPDYSDAHANLANVCKDQGRLEEALEHARRAVDLAPDSPEAWCALGRVLRHEGDPADALVAFRRALELKPDYAEAVAGEAAILDLMGDTEAAWQRVQSSLEANGDSTHLAVVFAGLSKRVGRQREAVEMLERLLDRAGLWPGERALTHFALGDQYDSLKEYDRAFEHYRQGNEFKAGRFDAAAHAAFVDEVIRTFSRDFLAGAPCAADPSDRPVFIVGMPRSGTSLVEQILASHPRVHGAGELRDINRAAADLPGLLGSGDAYPSCMTMFSSEAADTLSRRYLDRLAGLAPDAARVTDKMPHNFLHLGLIQLLFPGARIIHCKRDPLDTCLSCYFRDFAGAHPYAYDLESLGFYYKEYERLMEHWGSVLEIPMMEIAYEDVVQDLEASSRALVEFCGLEWDERCLDFHKTERVTRTASYDQVRQPIYSHSVGRWQHYGQHLGVLRNVLRS